MEASWRHWHRYWSTASPSQRKNISDEGSAFSQRVPRNFDTCRQEDLLLHSPWLATSVASPQSAWKLRTEVSSELQRQSRSWLCPDTLMLSKATKLFANGSSFCRTHTSWERSAHSFHSLIDWTHFSFLQWKEGTTFVESLRWWRRLSCFLMAMPLLNEASAWTKPFCILQPNILEDSLVGARHAYDGIKGSGGPLNVEITRPLLASCRNAGRRRNLALLERKSLEEKEQKEAVERKEDEYRLRELKTKKAAINLQRESLEQEIQDLKRRRVMFWVYLKDRTVFCVLYLFIRYVDNSAA